MTRDWKMTVRFFWRRRVDIFRIKKQKWVPKERAFDAYFVGVLAELARLFHAVVTVKLVVVWKRAEREVVAIKACIFDDLHTFGQWECTAQFACCG